MLFVCSNARSGQPFSMRKWQSNCTLPNTMKHIRPVLIGNEIRAGCASQSVGIKLQHQLSLLSTCSPVGIMCGCAKVVRAPKPLSMFLWRHSWQLLRQNHRVCVYDVTEHNITLLNLLDKSGLQPDLFWGGNGRYCHYHGGIRRCIMPPHGI